MHGPRDRQRLGQKGVKEERFSGRRNKSCFKGSEALIIYRSWRTNIAHPLWGKLWPILPVLSLPQSYGCNASILSSLLTGKLKTIHHNLHSITSPLQSFTSMNWQHPLDFLYSSILWDPYAFCSLGLAKSVTCHITKTLVIPWT